MNKERPCELNQKIKRLKTSRDGQKLNNREKTKENNAKGVHAFRRIADEGTREVRFTEDAVA